MHHAHASALEKIDVDGLSTAEATGMFELAARKGWSRATGESTRRRFWLRSWFFRPSFFDTPAVGHSLPGQMERVRSQETALTRLRSVGDEGFIASLIAAGGNTGEFARGLSRTLVATPAEL